MFSCWDSLSVFLPATLKTGFYFIATTDLELPMQTRLALNSTCLCFLSAKIKGICHPIQPLIFNDTLT